jgi:hypothetical protein
MGELTIQLIPVAVAVLICIGVLVLRGPARPSVPEPQLKSTIRNRPTTTRYTPPPRPEPDDEEG